METRIVLAAVVVALAAAAGAGATLDRTPVQQIIRSPEQFYGETVRFESQVSRQIDHRVWEMANGRLFLISDDPVNPPPRDGDVLRITGTVHPLTPEVIEDRLGINIEDHFFTDDFLADDVAVVVKALLRVEWPVPVPTWFWVWARWYLDHGEFADDRRFRSDADRPRSAPLPIPDWAWSRLQPMISAS